MRHVIKLAGETCIYFPGPLCELLEPFFLSEGFWPFLYIVSTTWTFSLFDRLADSQLLNPFWWSRLASILYLSWSENKASSLFHVLKLQTGLTAPSSILMICYLTSWISMFYFSFPSSDQQPFCVFPCWTGKLMFGTLSGEG